MGWKDFLTGYRKKGAPTLPCPHCGELIEIKQPYEGKKVKCPQCGLVWVVKFVPGLGYELIPEDNVWVLE